MLLRLRGVVLRTLSLVQFETLTEHHDAFSLVLDYHLPEVRDGVVLRALSTNVPGRSNRLESDIVGMDVAIFVDVGIKLDSSGVKTGNVMVPKIS